MTKPKEVTQTRLLQVLDAVWKDCYEEEFEAIRCLIESFTDRLWEAWKGGQATSEPTAGQLKRALADWRQRLVEQNRAADCSDFWSEPDNRDETNFKAIRRLIEKEGR